MYSISSDIAFSRIHKDWGIEDWLVNDRQGNYCLKAMELTPGHHVSLHIHQKKDETFLILEGMMVLERSDGDPQVGIYSHTYCHGDMQVQVQGQIAREGDRIRIRPGVYHRFYSVGAFPCKFLEVSTGDFDDDNERFPGQMSQ